MRVAASSDKPKREKTFHFSVGLGFGNGIGSGFWYDSGYWSGFGLGSGLGFGSEIRVQGLSRDCSLASDLVICNSLQLLQVHPEAGCSFPGCTCNLRQVVVDH